LPLIVLVVFLPAIVVPYAFADDYPLLAWAHGFYNGDPTWRYWAAQGRPLAGLAHMAGFRLIDSIASLRFIRLASLIGIGLLAVFLQWRFVSTGMKRWAAAALVLVIVTLPAFQVYAAWAAAFTEPYAALLGAAASAVTIGALGLERRHAAVRLGCAFLLLLAALLTYQPTAMFFWVVAAVPMLGRGVPLARAKRLLSTHLLVAVPAMAADVAAWKYFEHLYGAPSPARGSVTHDLVGKMRWFVGAPLVQSLDFFDLRPSRLAAVAVAVLVGTGLVLLHQPRWKQSLSFLAIAVTLVPLTYLPNLATAEDWASYRTLGALAALVAVYLWLAAAGVKAAFVGPSATRITPPLRVLRTVAVAAAVFVAVGLVVWPLAAYPELASSSGRWRSGWWWFAVAALGVALLGAWIQTKRRHRPANSARTERQLAFLAGVAAAALAGTGVLLASRNETSLFVKPQSIETALFRSRVQAAVGPRTSRITIIRSAWWQGPAPQTTYDEFGLPSTSIWWLIEPAVFLFLHEDSSGRQRAQINNRPSTSPPLAKAVDMRDLAKYSDGWLIWTLSGDSASTSSTSYGATSKIAVQHQPSCAPARSPSR
jgi:hypothetical protein